MVGFIKYCKVKLAEKSGVLGVTAIASWLWLAAVYAIGLIDQPELVSYVEDGYFYGYYNFNMYPMRLIAWATAVVVSLFYSSTAFAPFFDRRGAAFNIMLPATRGEKFALTAMMHLLVMPILLSVVVIVNDYVWSYFLDIPMATKEFPWQRILMIVSSFTTLNAMFFCMGIFARRFQWAWALGVCLLLSSVFYIYVTMGERSVRNEFELKVNDPTILAVEVVVAVLLIVAAWLRWRKIELKG